MSGLFCLLRNTPVFNEMLDEELKQLEKITLLHTYPKRKYVFMEGEEAKSIFFIKEGAVKIYKIDENGKEQIINLLHPGEMFPPIGFFETAPYPASAEAIEKTELLEMKIDHLDHLLIEQPTIALKMMKIMGQKLSFLLQRVHELISQDVGHRLIRTLLRLAKEAGIADENGVHINMPLTNQDLANMVGASRETVNRLLNDLKKDGLLEASRQRIFIYDLDQLRQQLIKRDNSVKEKSK